MASTSNLMQLLLQPTTCEEVVTFVYLHYYSLLIVKW